MSEIYTAYAFTGNELEKGKKNRETYKEICEKWRILVRDYSVNEIDESNFDLIIKRKPEYLHSVCKIIKNNTDLTLDEIALVCDSGNLCFGYKMQGDDFYIFED